VLTEMPRQILDASQSSANVFIRGIDSERPASAT